MSKTMLSFFAVALCHQIAVAQTPSSCQVVPNLQTHYEQDVQHLAIKRIYQQQLADTVNIGISALHQDTIWDGLAAIYHLTALPERDSVFNNYCIHQEVSSYISPRVYVAVDTTQTWTQAWRSLNTTTGVTALDNLLSTYGFTISNFFGNTATLQTSQTLNTSALCDSLAMFGGVLYSEPASIIGDGNWITYSTSNTDRFYNFSVRYGDCPSGCTSSRTFQFKVYADCSVEYLGTVTVGLDPIPTPPNCNIAMGIRQANLSNSNATIFPNPVRDLLTVQTKSPETSQYSISNMLGQIQKTGNLAQSPTIDTKDLLSGVYILTIIDNKQTSSTFKFVKE